MSLYNLSNKKINSLIIVVFEQDFRGANLTNFLTIYHSIYGKKVWFRVIHKDWRKLFCSATSDFAGNFMQKKTMAFIKHGGQFSKKIVQTDSLVSQFTTRNKKINPLLTGLGSVSIVKNCNLWLKTATAFPYMKFI